MRKTGYDIKPLLDYVKEHDVKTPIRVELQIEKIDYGKNKTVTQTRYMRAYLNGNDVTDIVAKGASLSTSDRKDTNGCLIVRGSGRDMVNFVQQRLHHGASLAGKGNFIEPEHAVYLGRKLSKNRDDYRNFFPV